MSFLFSLEPWSAHILCIGMCWGLLRIKKVYKVYKEGGENDYGEINGLIKV